MSRIPAISTHYAGCKYRSRTEARWAVFFDAIGLRHHYEFEGFSIRSGAYLPDFWLPELKMFFEVKGAEPTDEERAKCAELSRAAECDALLAIGPPEPRFQLLWFDRDGQRDGLYVIARDRLSACGLWLVAEDDGQHLGPNATRPLERPRGPMFSGALEDAYMAAASAQFERGEGRKAHPVIHEHDPERLAA
jgi:hypothetical protein